MNKKFALYFVSIMTCMVLLACSSNDNSHDEVITPQEDTRYYIKYEVDSSSKTGFGTTSYDQTITCTTEKGKETITKTGKEIEWDATYGPFKKGTSVSLNVSAAVNNHARIYASRDKEPFVIKAEDFQKSKPIQLSYTIDF